jgi:hypothetical protein
MPLKTPNTCACSAGAGKTAPAAVLGGEDTAESEVLLGALSESLQVAYRCQRATTLKPYARHYWEA